MPSFEVEFLPEYTDEAVLDEMRRVAGLISPGQPLTKAVFVEHAKVGHSTVRRRFGGWQAALERAGLAHLYHGQPVSEKMRTQKARGISNSDLITELQRVHSLVGKQWLTTNDFNEHSICSEEAVRIRFGNFRSGLEAAGIPVFPGKERRYTDDECFENIATVWTHLTRSPLFRDMFQAPSAILGKTYVTRWGTWRRTLAAFVDWSNGEAQSTENNDSQVMSAAPYVLGVTKNNSEEDNREVRPGLRFKVFARDRFRCKCCGRTPANDIGVELHADHILAVANGGKTTSDNLQTLCRDCNLGKGRIMMPA